MDKYGLKFARKFNKLLIVDFEATCYDNNVWPEGETSEPIEFGLTLLDISRIDNKVKIVISKSDSILVVPKFSRISLYCTNLTGHTYENLKRNGSSYPEACARIINSFHATTIPWASWGQYDYNLWLKANKLYPEAKECFSHSHFNLSPLFSMKRGLNKKIGVSRALEILGLEFQGRPHSGKDDSFNIARLTMYTIFNQDPNSLKVENHGINI